MRKRNRSDEGPTTDEAIRQKRRKECSSSAREREFERLYRESYEMVYNFVRYRMAGDSAAEDVVAEAYLKAASSFGKFDPSRAKFSTWVVKIASNCMRDYWRHAHPAAPLDGVSEERFAQPDETEAIADRELADRLLAVLSPEDRDLVVMRYREGYRNVEIAAELGLNPSTVSTRLASALKKMRHAASPATS